MCQFYDCKTEPKPSGFCIGCGKEVCPDCADKENQKMHMACNFCNFPNIPPKDCVDGEECLNAHLITKSNISVLV